MKNIVLVVLAFGVLVTASGLSQMKQEEKKHQFALKELKVFHDVMHPLYHDALPKGDFDKIRSKLEVLLKDATAIQKARVPKRLAGRQKEFEKKSAGLVALLTDMVATKDKVDDATIEKMFNDMHEAFESIAELVK